MIAGCYTALITPFAGDAVDYEGLEKLVAFQIENGITGILACGTTGESPVLSWQEHNEITEKIIRLSKGKCASIAGTGSNNTRECWDATEHAAAAGVDAVLLVDPYYNGPSSLEIRREYVEPVAAGFPGIEVIPYVIPGRTGAQLLPEDLAILKAKHPNVTSVKEATGNPDNMRRTRVCCGPDFAIFSGDDPMTFDMMCDANIKAAGVISVASNVAPAAVTRMVRLLLEGNRSAAEQLMNDLSPLYNMVTVKTTETTPHGEVVCRARNPLPYKSLMALLGMPAGGCRRPLGKMSSQGLHKVIEAAKSVHRRNPSILAPVEAFFGVDINARLDDPSRLEGLCYGSYA